MVPKSMLISFLSGVQLLNTVMAEHSIEQASNPKPELLAKIKAEPKSQISQSEQQEAAVQQQQTQTESTLATAQQQPHLSSLDTEQQPAATLAATSDQTLALPQNIVPADALADEPDLLAASMLAELQQQALPEETPPLPPPQPIPPTAEEPEPLAAPHEGSSADTLAATSHQTLALPQNIAPTDALAAETEPSAEAMLAELQQQALPEKPVQVQAPPPPIAAAAEKPEQVEKQAEQSKESPAAMSTGQKHKCPLPSTGSSPEEGVMAKSKKQKKPAPATPAQIGLGKPQSPATSPDTQAEAAAAATLAAQKQKQASSPAASPPASKASPPASKASPAEQQADPKSAWRADCSKQQIDQLDALIGWDRSDDGTHFIVEFEGYPPLRVQDAVPCQVPIVIDSSPHNCRHLWFTDDLYSTDSIGFESSWHRFQYHMKIVNFLAVVQRLDGLVAIFFSRMY